MCCAAILTSAAVAADATNRFGFTGPEIFPIDSQIGLLRSADLDWRRPERSDRRQQFALQNQPALQPDRQDQRHSNTPSIGEKPELNELPPDARFRIESIASEKRISSLVVADLNGDGRPDIAYYGEPKELVVLYNQGTNGWSAPKRWAD